MKERKERKEKGRKEEKEDDLGIGKVYMDWGYEVLSLSQLQTKHNQLFKKKFIYLNCSHSEKK